jgi:hypothetical protein
MEVKMLNEADIILDAYEQSVENDIDTFAPVSSETKRRLDAILAQEKSKKTAPSVSVSQVIRLNAAVAA